MFSTRKAKEQAITLESILSKVSEYDIYERYLGKFKIGMIYNSPFRKDKNPSFGIYRGRQGNLMFKDHGDGVSGNVIKFVQLITGINDYQQILIKIHNDMRLTNNQIAKCIREAEEEQIQTVIGIVKQPYTLAGLRYWKQFGISSYTLKKFNVYSIKYYLCNGIVKAIYKDENPMFAYQVYDKFKIYRPLGDKFTKWRNNLTDHDIQGYAQLPESGDLLIITKSLKDVMVLYEMGIPAISPSSESTFIPQDVLDIVLKRFKQVIILFDRDVAGVRQSRSNSLKTGLYAMFIHKKYKAKDISDAVQLHGLKEIQMWLLSMLYRKTHAISKK